MVVEDGGAESPHAALEAVALEALQQPPCVVSFSGGRDSSAVLAIATAAARRHDLPDPVPVSMRWTHAPEADESSWQELVVRHLRLRDWEIVDGAPHLDSVGELAACTLRRHGLLFPANAYVQRLVIERALGGTVLTGLGGDHLFGEWRWQRAADVLALRCAPRAGDAARLALWASPRALRLAIARRRAGSGPAWLSREARERVVEARLRERAEEPRTWAHRVPWVSNRRALAHMRHSGELLAADLGARMVYPLVAPRVVRALARAGGRLGWGGRTAAMRALFGDVLPPAIIERRTKAGTYRAYDGPATREFIASWDGSGVDPRLVDAEAARRAWAVGEAPDGRAELLLQAAWLSTRPRDHG